MVNVGAYPAVWVGISPCSGRSNSLNFNVHQLETRLWMNASQKVGTALTTESWSLKLQYPHWKNGLREMSTLCHRGEEGSLPLSQGSSPQDSYRRPSLTSVWVQIHTTWSQISPGKNPIEKKISCKWIGRSKCKKKRTHLPQDFHR